MAKPIVLERALSPGENFFRCRTEVGFYYNFASVAAYSRNLTSDLPLLYRALRKTILDYHILTCNLFKEGDGHVIRPIESAVFGDFVSFSPESFSPQNLSVSEEFLRKLCRTPYFTFNTNTPLFKVIIAGTHDLGVTFEHTLSDGVVASLFQEAFLENLAYCDDTAKSAEYVQLYGPEPETISMQSTIFSYQNDQQYLRNSLPPPLEMVMQDPSMDYADNDQQHYSKVAPQDYPEKWPGRFPATKEMSVAFKLFNIPRDKFAQILQRCKENGVTFTSYFNYIQALALQPVFGANHHISSCVAITLRRFLSPSKVTEEYRDILTKDGYRIFGLYAHMGVPELIPPITDFSWDHVRLIHAHSVQSVKNDKLLSMSKKWYNEASSADNNREFFECALGKAKAHSVKISNLGLAKFPVFDTKNGPEPWTVNDIVFAQDLAPHASEFVFNLVSSARGGLNVVMSYYDHRFDDSAHENFDTYPGMVRAKLLEHAGL